MSFGIGILVVTHGDAGGAMLAAVRTLVGASSVEGIEALTVPAGEAQDVTRDHIADAVRRLNRGHGVLLVCDLGGSTPWSCCAALKREGLPVEVMCGLNLPMLVKLASADREQTTPDELAQIAADTATRSIRVGADVKGRP